MTSNIQNIIAKMQVLKFHSPVIRNVSPFDDFEYDVMSISKSKMICEFEVKISRADFKKPKEIEKMKIYDQVSTRGKVWSENKRLYIDVPNYFSYCCPPDMISIDEIPAFAGLYYCSNKGYLEIRKPKRIHSFNFNLDKIHNKTMRIYSERTFLGEFRLTYKNKLNALKYKLSNGETNN